MTEPYRSSRANSLRTAAYELLSRADEIDESRPLRLSAVGASDLIDDNTLFALAAREIATRELRRRCLNEGLFGEPAWDMLLYLFLRAGEGLRTLKTSVTNASHCPHSTALRYLDLLHDYGMVRTQRSTTDARVLLVSLTEAGFRSMANYFALSCHRQGHDRMATRYSRPDSPFFCGSSEVEGMDYVS